MNGEIESPPNREKIRRTFFAYYDLLYDYISPGIRSGTYTIMKNTMISPIRYGITDLEIRSIGSPVIPEATNRLMATGGVIIPIAMPTTNRIPKCTVLIHEKRMSK